jgi:hypothetical protein
LKYPHKPAKEPTVVEAEDQRAMSEAQASAASSDAAEPALSGIKGKTWFAGTPMDAPRDENGNFLFGWHWNMPYTVKRNLPDWCVTTQSIY